MNTVLINLISFVSHFIGQFRSTEVSFRFCVIHMGCFVAIKLNGLQPGGMLHPQDSRYRLSL